MKKRIKPRRVEAFAEYLRREEREKSTIEAYLRSVRDFAQWLDGGYVTKEAVLDWKEQLAQRYATSTVNVKLASVNALFKFMGWTELHVRALRKQRKTYRETSRDLTREEYQRLHAAAEKMGRTRLSLLLETICSVGIRVSEIRYITVEAARKGEAEISLKGKIRTIVLPDKLCRKLLDYAIEKKIASGEIFITGSGRGMSRKQVWFELKSLCETAEVEPSKVFPHNLRHLFAKTFYQSTGDIVLLSDLLGHTSIETTRIYLVSTGMEHAKALDRLGLVS